MSRTMDLVSVFEDTRRFYETNQSLVDATEESIRQTVFYEPQEYPEFRKRWNMKALLK
ncbi:MAG: hypothetical protein IJ242_10220 [Clostridia bacterium]|nr:hypothetical protein [Clostridia bacterium]